VVREFKAVVANGFGKIFPVTRSQEHRKKEDVGDEANIGERKNMMMTISDLCFIHEQ
jgi:hypothetical protein